MVTSYKTISPISPLHGFGQPITALSFDPVSDILWVGLNSGTVSAYLGTRGARGPSFPVGGGVGVKKIAAGDTYVRALGNSHDGLGSWTKGGMNKWFFRYELLHVSLFINVDNNVEDLRPAMLSLSQTHPRPPTIWWLLSIIQTWFC